MESIGSYQAKSHLSRLLDRVAQGESLTITKHGRPVAQLVPIDHDKEARSRSAALRIQERRARLKCVSVTELIDSIHEGHRY